jgi:hypothetical protein
MEPLAGLPRINFDCEERRVAMLEMLELSAAILVLAAVMTFVADLIADTVKLLSLFRRRERIRVATHH